MRMARALAALAATTTLIVVAASCGDDDTESGAEASAPAAAATDVAASETDPPSDDTAVCAPYIDLTLAFNGEPDLPTLVPMLDEIDANAPTEIADELGTMMAAARSVIESDGQDFAAFEAPEFGAAQAVVDPWIFERCPFDQTAEVTATEYAFDGLGDELAAGRSGVLLTNEGDEAHELALMRKNDGVAESWEELLALPEEEAMSKVAQVGGAFAATKGSSGLLIADLTPGEYIAICFIPVGTSMGDDGEFVEGTGAPHFTEGMQHEFTVAG